jgi:putative drug exporter of the RND superfamily
MTLTPALLGFAGMRIVAKRYRFAAVPLVEDAPAENEPSEFDGLDDPDVPDPVADVPRSSEPEPPIAAASPPEPVKGFFVGWVRLVTRWPIVTVVAIVVLLGLATIPAAQLRLALPDAGSLPEDNPARVTYDLIADHFGPGYNGPLIVTGSIIQSSDPVGLMNSLAAELRTVPGVAAVPLSTPNETGDTGIVQVIPKGAPDSQQTKDLVATIRGMHDHFEKKYGADLSVTGYTAAGIDISDRLADALLPFGLLVVGLSLILLAMVFRSVAVPVTAALGYLLSVGAAFGITTLVFENGFLAGPLNVAALGSVISFMPIILMGVLFGLAMDYEVFLVSRMREDYVHTHDPHGAVRRGFLGSARVVTAAAIIMFAVFAAFIPEGDASIQPIALGLAVGVAIDAFLVRMTLIPAVLVLLGNGAWWIPRWLDRILPSFDVEGEGLQQELDAAQWPEPGSRLAIAADGLRVATPDRVLVDELTIRMPAGGVLLMTGPPSSGKTAVLMALSGRFGIAAGRVKVLGLVLPTRSATVRSRSAVARLAGAGNPLADLRDALAGQPGLLVIDDLDRVHDPSQRHGVARILASAFARANEQARPFTLLVSCGNLAQVDELLPLVPRVVIQLESRVDDSRAAMVVS